MLLKYVQQTGAIVGVWESNSLDVLQAQQGEGDPVHGYLLSLLDVAASTVEQDYQVLDGALVPRASR